MENCLFCQDSFKEKAIYTDDYFYMMIDNSPVNFGHLLIIPHRHIATFFELSPEESADLVTVIKIAQQKCRTEAVKTLYESNAGSKIDSKTKQFCQEVLKQKDIEPTGYNIGVNNGASAGQTVFHLHIHLIPRYDGDVANPVGGVRNIIPDRCNYKN